MRMSAHAQTLRCAATAVHLYVKVRTHRKPRTKEASKTRVQCTNNRNTRQGPAGANPSSLGCNAKSLLPLPPPTPPPLTVAFERTSESLGLFICEFQPPLSHPFYTYYLFLTAKIAGPKFLASASLSILALARKL
jgi:hypothetical protein